MLISTLHRNVTSSHSMHLFLHLCIMYHAWNFVMHPLLIFIESVTTNNWSLAIDPISDSCVGVPRSNAYETIDVRYRWEGAYICILLYGSIARDPRVQRLGANMLTHVVMPPHIPVSHVQLFQPPSCLSPQVCHLRQDWVYTFFSFDIFIPEIEQEAVLQIEYHFCWRTLETL